MEKIKQSKQYGEALNDIVCSFTDILEKYRSFDEDVLHAMRSQQLDATGGTPNQSRGDLEQNQLQTSVEQLDAHDLAQIDQVQQLVNARTDDILRIHRLMGDVNKIAKDINKEMNVQADKVDDIVNDMEEAESNVSGALEQLEQIKRKRKTSMKVMIGAFGCLLILLLLVFLVMKNMF